MNAPELFEVLARSTWRTIGQSHRNRIIFGEDAITSINLNALSSPGVGVLVEDTRVTEATKGCDFELWVGNDERGWSRYAIQAKKITARSSSYSRLNHKVRGRSQIDVLDEYARLNRAAAVYCLYNYSTLAHRWYCNLPRESDQLGCSVVPLNVVKKALDTRGGRSFVWFHQQRETLPWRCLVRCPYFIGRLGHTTAEGWLPRNQYFHERLPQSLKRLQNARDDQPLVDAPDLYSRQTTLRPAWVGVIDLGTPNAG